MMKRTIPILALGTLLAACGGGSGETTIDIGVKDTPVDDANAVVMTFTQIELIDGNGGKETFDLDPVVQVDLLDMQGEKQALLVTDQPIKAGVYQEIRLHADMPNSNCNSLTPPFASYVSVGDPEELYPLISPSSGSSGFKVKGPITIAAGNRSRFVVDFDLRKSLHERGSNGCYNLKPVLRVADLAETGTLSGSVSTELLATEPSCAGVDPATAAGVAVYVFENPDGVPVVPDDYDNNDPEPLTTAMLTPVTDGEGNVLSYSYTVGFVLTGDYTVALSCNAGSDVPPVTEDPADGDDTAGDPPAVSFIDPQQATMTTAGATVNFPAPAP